MAEPVIEVELDPEEEMIPQSLDEELCVFSPPSPPANQPANVPSPPNQPTSQPMCHPLHQQL